ncbi:DUF6284 family protein [Streptomyces sp. RTd22]|uniref:DUF6284 family protein n=1 Tax=Streptomyces sp. RTd22 TaxID=1841249 RepID=UPI0007C522AF|nr:DUF6284 family protein [Streptomyces sp. RTd22]
MWFIGTVKAAVTKAEHDGGPTVAELDAIEAEMPVIEAEIELLDVQIELLDRELYPIDAMRVRRARRRLLDERVKLANRSAEQAEVSA